MEPNLDLSSLVTQVLERLRTEAALLAQNERFDAALANMSQGLCMYDPASRVVVHNERFIVRLVDDIRASIVDGTFHEFKRSFLADYYGVN